MFTAIHCPYFPSRLFPPHLPKMFVNSPPPPTQNKLMIRCRSLFWAHVCLSTSKDNLDPQRCCILAFFLLCLCFAGKFQPQECLCPPMVQTTDLLVTFSGRSRGTVHSTKTSVCSKSFYFMCVLFREKFEWLSSHSFTDHEIVARTNSHNSHACHKFVSERNTGLTFWLWGWSYLAQGGPNKRAGGT